MQLGKQIAVYEKYLKSKLSFGKMYYSPYREEDNPSLSFWQGENDILWRDWGDPMQDKPQDVYSFYACNESCSKTEAYKRLNKANISTFAGGDRINPVYKKRAVRRLKKKLIKIIERPFNMDDLLFWSEYGITLNTLKKFKVKAASKVFLNDKETHVESKNKPVYAYEITSKGDKYYKIYAPKNSFKWMFNGNQEMLFGIDLIPDKGELLIITKSLKDVMALRELGYSAIAPQAETAIIKKSVINNLKRRFKYIIIFFDNDSTGIKFAKRLSTIYKLMYIYLPQDHKAKDISDYIKSYGMDNAKTQLKKILDDVIKED